MFRAHVLIIRRSKLHSTACGIITPTPVSSHLYHTYRCDDTRGRVMQFWPPDDEHMCSKHVEAWNKLIVKQKCCASSWLITEMHGQQNVAKWQLTSRFHKSPLNFWVHLTYHKFLNYDSDPWSWFDCSTWEKNSLNDIWLLRANIYYSHNSMMRLRYTYLLLLFFHSVPVCQTTKAI